MTSSPSPAEIVSRPAPPQRLSEKALPTSVKPSVWFARSIVTPQSGRLRRDHFDTHELVVAGAIEVGGSLDEVERVPPAATIDDISPYKADDTVIARTGSDDVITRAADDEISKAG